MTRRRIVMGLTLLALVTALMGAVVARGADAGPGLRAIALGGQPVGVALDRRAGRVFVLCASANPAIYDGHVAVLDAASGQLLRTVAVGHNPTDIAIDERSSRVFVTDVADGTVSTLDARGGALLSTVSVGVLEPHDAQRIALDARANRLFVAADGVQVLDARSGAILHTVPVAADALIVDEQTSRVFTASYGSSSVHMLDALSGASVHTVAVGSSPLQFTVDAQAGRIFVKGDAGLSMLDARSGRLLAAIHVGMARGAPIAVGEAAGRVFVVDYGLMPPYTASVTTLDARSGAIVRIVVVGSPGVPVVAGRYGRVFVPDYATDAINVLDARSGLLLRTVPVGTATTDVAVDEKSGRVFVVTRGAVDDVGNATSRGSVSVLDARSGALLRSIPVGWNPVAVAVDEQTGRAFVANAGGTVRLPDRWSWLPSWLRGRLPLLPPARSHLATMPGSVTMLDASR